MIIHLNIKPSIITLLIIIIIASGCSNSHQPVGPPTLVGTPTLIAESEVRPTPASTLPELVRNLSSDEALVRVVSAYALQEYDPDVVAAGAIPSLINNLYYDNIEVPTSAAVVLGWLGPRAQPAVPDLISVMEDTEVNLNVRSRVAEVLAEIGDVSAVPALAKQLYQNPGSSYFYEIACADSIAILAKQPFRDAGASAYHFTDGIPWIVTDAINWWEKTGQYQDWGK